MSATRASAPQAPPAGIAALAERYDPDPIDVPGGRARVRLELAGGDAGWDALIDAAAAAPRAGGHEQRARRPPQRRRRHLAGDRLRRARRNEGVPRRAGSGAPQPAPRRGLPGGHERRDRARAARLRDSAHPNGGPHLDPLRRRGRDRRLHPRPGRDEGVVPADRRGAGRLVPRRGDRPARASASPTSRSARRTTPPGSRGPSFDAMDALGVERAHLAGNSMGGRVAIEAGLMDRERVGGLVLLSPALAWLRDRRWAPVVRLLRPELGLIQLAPRPVVEGVVRRLIPGAADGWAAAGVDEFLRSYLTPARAGGLLRGGAQHLPGRAARRRRLLDPPGGARTGLAVRLGPPRHARADRLHEARGAGAAAAPATWSSTAATCRSSSGRARRTRRCGSSWRAVGAPRSSKPPPPKSPPAAAEVAAAEVAAAEVAPPKSPSPRRRRRRVAREGVDRSRRPASSRRTARAGARRRRSRPPRG